MNIFLYKFSDYFVYFNLVNLSKSLKNTVVVAVLSNPTPNMSKSNLSLIKGLFVYLLFVCCVEKRNYVKSLEHYLKLMKDNE